MQTAAKSNLILTSFSSLNRMAGIQPATGKPELNQQISQALIRRINRRQSLDHLAEKLISVADIAYPLRRMETVEQASDILLGLPLHREYKSVASYYKAYCVKRRGHFDEARTIFERVVDELPAGYKARAIIGLGAVAFDRGDFQSAMPLYIEASRAVIRAREFDPLAAFYAQAALAILKSIDGNHKDALADLGRMFPLVRAVSSSYPTLYYNLLNSYAVELLESGSIIEAQNVSKIVLASPFADAYPEYRETSIDIALRGRRASRSVVSFAQSKLNAPNVLRLPPAEHVNSDTSVEPVHDHQKPARVFDMQKWKKKMGKEPNGDHKDSKPDEDMMQDEMLYEIVNLFTEKDMDREIRLEMLQSIRKLVAKKRANKQEKEPGEDKDKDSD